MAQLVKNSSAVQETQETWVWSVGQEDPMEEEMAARSNILPWQSHGQRSLPGCNPEGHKGLDTTEPLGKSTAGEMIHPVTHGVSECLNTQLSSPENAFQKVFVVKPV